MTWVPSPGGLAGKLRQGALSGPVKGSQSHSRSSSKGIGPVTLLSRLWHWAGGAQNGPGASMDYTRPQSVPTHTESHPQHVPFTLTPLCTQTGTHVPHTGRDTFLQIPSSCQAPPAPVHVP